MKSRKVSYMPYVGGFLLAVLVLAGPFLFSASRVAHAHTFSTSESAQFLSLVEQIRAEMGLVTLNLENNNATLARNMPRKLQISLAIRPLTRSGSGTTE